MKNKSRKRRMINGENYPLDSDVFDDVRSNINENIRDTERAVYVRKKKKGINSFTNF